MAWKDSFQFSRGERIGVFVLIGIILVTLSIPYIYRLTISKKPTDFRKFEQAVAQFEAKLEESRLAIEAERESRRIARSTGSRQQFSFDEPIMLNPFRFNPNNLPKSEWQRMGIPENIANRIHNYEKAGGNFRFKEDLSRIYSITDDIYNQLEPFIDLPSRSSRTEQQFASTTYEAASGRESSTLPRNIVELNSADSATLVTVRGIGPAFSRRIINYRERLGGFVDVNQLMEVFGMDSTRFNEVKDWFVVDKSLVAKINVNTSSWEELVKLPYINSNLANSIIALRRQHGEFKSAEDLKKSKLVTDSLFTKILPYISID